MVYLSLLAFLGMGIVTAASIRLVVPLCPLCPREGGTHAGQERVWVAALGAFVFLPAGSLPPLCNTAWSGAAAFACLSFSFLLVNKKRALLPLGALGLTAAAFAFFAWARGVPGNIANLGTVVAVPVWGLVSFPEAVGFLLLGAGSLLSAKALVGTLCWRPGFGLTVRTLLLGGIWTILFIPWNVAFFENLPLVFAAGVDLLFFWVKSALVALWLLQSSIRSTALPGASCCCVGALLVFFGVC